MTMARKIRSRGAAVQAAYDLAALQQQPGLNTVLRTQLSLRSGIRNGYLNRLNRQRRKTAKQLKGISTSGIKLTDWAI